MDKVQFRKQMGLLGQQEHPFLADRMFEVFDTKGTNGLELSQFMTIMDILQNGTEDERNQFSFALMDQDGQGSISFQEFHDYFTRVIQHWSSLINSHVRVNREEIHKIFVQIDVNGKNGISYSEYRKAIRKTPDLLDWFELLNSAKDKGDKSQNKITEDQITAIRAEEEEKDKDIVKIDKQQVEQIVNLRDIHKKKTTEVKKLKQEVDEMNGQTEEQLYQIMKQIEMLSGQVKEQLNRKEEEKKQWDESVLLQQETMSQFDATKSQIHDFVMINEESHLDNTPQALHHHIQGSDQREQTLDQHLLGNDEDAFNDMPFAPIPNADKVKDDRVDGADYLDHYSRQGTRQAAMTFGVKGSRIKQDQQNQQQQQQQAQQYYQQQAQYQQQMQNPQNHFGGVITTGPLDEAASYHEGHQQQQYSGENKGSSAHKQEYDSNATLQQWQQKGLFPKTNNGSNSPTGMSSNFHFSQFNYEFTSRNPSMRIEESSNVVPRKIPHNNDNFYNDNVYLRTHDGQGRESDDISGDDFMTKKFQKAQSKPFGELSVVQDQLGMTQPLPVNITQMSQKALPSKTYEEILGPQASLNDILNFDFAGRYQSKNTNNNNNTNRSLQNPYKQSQTQQANHPEQPLQSYASRLQTQPELQTRPSEKAISPIFEVLIKLREGREQAKEKVGEKHIESQQVPSKQRGAQNTMVDPMNNQVSQKEVDDPDADDIVLDPESPINSASPRDELSNVPTTTLNLMQNQQNTASSLLKVNQRHALRQEARKNQNNYKSFDNQSNVSSNLNKLSQMQGGGTASGNFGQQAPLEIQQHYSYQNQNSNFQQQQLMQAQAQQYRGQPKPNLASSMKNQHNNHNNPLVMAGRYTEQNHPDSAHANTTRKVSLNEGFQPSPLHIQHQTSTNPHSPLIRNRKFAEDQIPMSNLVMQTSESEQLHQITALNNPSKKAIGEDDIQRFAIQETGIPGQIIGNNFNQQWYTNDQRRALNNNMRTKSAYNDDRLTRTNGIDDTLSQFSQPGPQNNHLARSNKTGYAVPRPPESPKVEKDMLNKLDEVNSNVKDWLEKLMVKKLQTQKLPDNLGLAGRSKSAMPAQRRNLDAEKDSEDSHDEEAQMPLQALDQLKKIATAKEQKQKAVQRAKSVLLKIDTSGSKDINFEKERARDLVVSTKQTSVSADSQDDEVIDMDFSVIAAHNGASLTNAHTALAEVKQTKSNKKKDKTFIHFGNDNWNLVLQMLFGIRQSVVSCRYDDVFQLTDAEFKSKLRYELEAVENQKIWNIKKYEFYDFSPRVFNLIRKFYGINTNEYLKSIGPETLFGSLNMGKINSLKSQCSAGKSGSLFYYTADGLYMLKTISHDEFEHFKAIMKNYYYHMLAYPHTMIARFYGLHKIKFTKTTGIERVYFVIMGNVFNTQQNINVRYDLKGSTYGRITRKRKDEVLSSTVALKDCDWLNDKRIINLREEQRNTIAQQLKQDTKFFQENNINDYSVLLGISKIKGGHREAQSIVRNSINYDMLYLQGVNSAIEEDTKRKNLKRTQSYLNPLAGSHIGGSMLPTIEEESNFTSRAQSMHPSTLGRQQSESELLLHERSRPEKAFYESQDGGLVSADGTEIYFMGIIDILTNFGTKKKLENAVRSIVHNSKTISCIPPLQYGDRFYRFMTEKVYITQQQINEEIKARQAKKPSPIFDSKFE